jgi:hypothetical protein
MKIKHNNQRADIFLFFIFIFYFYFLFLFFIFIFYFIFLFFYFFFVIRKSGTAPRQDSQAAGVPAVGSTSTTK